MSGVHNGVDATSSHDTFSLGRDYVQVGCASLPDIMLQGLDISVIDDSGLLGLVDFHAYRSYLGADWTYESLLAHFNLGMKNQNLLVWDCGDGGGQYIVRVRRSLTSETGYREITGGVVATSDSLLLSSYDALTMAAQFEDEPLPASHEAHQILSISTGSHRIRIVQTYDPKELQPSEGNPHFLLEIEAGSCDSWDSVAWLSA